MPTKTLGAESRAKPGESLAYPESDMEKRAALLFDRIYVNPYQSDRNAIPADLLFWSSDIDKQFEDSLALETAYFKVGLVFIGDVVEEKQELFQEALSQLSAHPERHADVLRLRAEFQNEKSAKELSAAAGRILWDAYSHRHRIFVHHGLPVVPLFPSCVVYDHRIVEGSSVAFEAALQSIPSIIEDELSWEQVLELRKDPEAKRKLRALRSWLQSGLTAESVIEAKEKIEQKLDDYEWAIRKHGLKTVTGGLTAVLDSKFLASVVGATGIGAILGGPVWGAISAGLLSISKISIWLAERKIEFADVQRGQSSEVAIIFESRKKHT